ncbi:MAG: Glutamyl-tRNA(Gln) amidotransferase subunit A [Chlamydiales bacterium]|nr:Glutamyl-tRNA(Gln) amidotransferase subunit A [Chlamydiales bacterium]MCH9635795.1 Glutamyl-tRNA(Gln) amidotransferase subunit A [Chlamydiales bacterium]MCH9704361.1 Asp-tRNA(Asn)/Glu-tRNA(Gln) amidotransferase subunit GatA [Chlamydiota bacterium]
MYRLKAHEIHEKFLKKELSAVEIVRYFLKRINDFDGKVGAFLTTFDERALAKATALDEKLARGERVGPLAAVPIGIKDNIHVKGELTTCASKFLSNYRALFDSTCTRLFEEADGILLGKLNMDEFAMGSSNENSAMGPTHNPWDLECVPGGSSGASAAAVAARLCPLTVGSDTGGSVRQPAALCGVVGLKPTYGRVSRYGLVAFGSSLDQIGPLAASVRDISMAMEVLGKHDPHDATSLREPMGEFKLDNDLSGKKIGVPWGFLEGLHEEPARCFNESIETLKSLGAEIVDVDLSILKYAIATYYIVATAEVSTNLARFDGVRYGVRAKAEVLDDVYDLSRSQGFGSEVKRRILLGTYVLSAGYQDAYYKRATKVRAKMIDHFEKVFGQCDAIVTPTSPIACFPAGAIQDPLEMYLQDIYTVGANLCRLPGISVPCGFNKENKPFGLQILGPRKSDPLICHMAHAFETATDFAQKIPQEFDNG